MRARRPHRPLDLLTRLAQAQVTTSVNAFDVLRPPNPGYASLIASIDVPTLLITSDSGIVTREQVQELQRLNPGLLTENIADAGHGIPYDQPEQTAAAIQNFVRRL